MHCSKCGLCCEETEMLLTEADVQLLEQAGYVRKDFMHYDSKNFAQLRNREGHCVFYDPNKHSCKVYKLRPLGCHLYPVIYGEGEGVITDDICAMRRTVSKTEIERKGKRLIRLLDAIDSEAENRHGST
jgi:Fe-S-cluster containining protein